MEVNTTEHSPWEMFHPDVEVYQILEEEATRLEEEELQKWTEAIDQCLAIERYNLFVVAPEPDESFSTSGGGEALLKQSL